MEQLGNRTMEQEREQKRKLYQEQRQAADKDDKKPLKIQSPLNQESLINRSAFENRDAKNVGSEQEEQRQRQEKAKERLEQSKELLNKGRSAGGGKIKAIKQAMSAVDQAGGSTEISHQAAEFILNVLWANVLTPWFFFTVIGLNIYAALSSGILDIIFPGMSKKLAPFGICTKTLPMGLGKFLGIVALIVLNLILICLLLIIVVFIYYLINPAELIKLLPGWEIISKMFSS